MYCGIRSWSPAQSKKYDMARHRTFKCFLIIGVLWGKPPPTYVFPLKRAGYAELWWFVWCQTDQRALVFCSLSNWTNSRAVLDLKCHETHEASIRGHTEARGHPSCHGLYYPVVLRMRGGPWKNPIIARTLIICLFVFLSKGYRFACPDIWLISPLLSIGIQATSMNNGYDNINIYCSLSNYTYWMK